MVEQPLVSVLMTAFNREKYIAEAIESVLASAYTNFELIIVDDCSNDNSFRIAKEYEKKDERIKVYANDRNLGQFYNRNKAASLASGKYLKYVDSDDLIMPDTLSVMVGGMEQFKEAAIGVVYGNKEKIDFLNSPFKVINSRFAYLWHYSNGGLLFPGPSGCIYKRDLFLLLNGFPVDLGINADIYTNLKMAATTDVVLFPFELIHWRRHSSQVDQLQKDNFKMQKERYLIDHKILFDEQIPLKGIELKRIKLSNRILYIRGAVINFLFKGEHTKFIELMRLANIPLYALPIAILPLRYLNSFKKLLNQSVK
jgi:glycosyltransferase involved in cell wall biosynthesis